MNNAAKWFPWVLVVVAGLYVLSKARPPKDDGPLHLTTAAQIPVLDGGRVKPLDTYARLKLMIISDRQAVTLPDGRKLSAIEWFLDVVSNSPASRQHRVFRIENEDVLTLAGLTPRPGLRYAIGEFDTRMNKIIEEARKAHQTDPAKRSVYQRKLLEFGKQLETYMFVSRRQQPIYVPPATGTDPHQWRKLSDLERLAADHSVD